jgi:hypothetical protein
MSDAIRGTDSRLLRLSAEDNVGVATVDISAGEHVVIGGEPVTVDQAVATGHKIALAHIAAGRHVIKYGLPIGSTTVDVRPGQYVHTHNLKSDYLPTYTLDGTNPYLRTD